MGYVVAFIAGVVLGALAGVLTVALLLVAGEDD